VDDQITFKELKKMEVQQSPTRELRFYIKKKKCKKKEKKKKRDLVQANMFLHKRYYKRDHQ
jgi:hypothetical protein